MRTADLLLRLALALAFLFPPVNALIDPYSWVGYFPSFVRDLGPELLLLHAFGIIEMILGLWILSGRRVFYPSVAAAGILVLIVITNIGDFQVLFRDLSLAGAALALAAMNRPRAKTELQ